MLLIIWKCVSQSFVNIKTFDFDSSCFSGEPSVLETKDNGAPQPKLKMENLPPEVQTKILELATRDSSFKDMLGYRFVNSQWKEIMNTIIEKRIVSGKFVFQGGMKITGAGRRRQQDQLHVSTHFQPGENPFQFNSLLLTGDKNVIDFYRNPGRHHIPMLLPLFASTFGGNLTSFSLQKQTIPIQTLVTMLGSMPRLKLVSLIDVKHVDALIKPDTVLPPPPPLPDLSILEVKSSSIQNQNISAVWLIVSYADQLKQLCLDTRDPLQALQKQTLYSTPLTKNATFRIATSSDVAFGNLKKLNISHPSRNFMNLSETPALHKLSVTIDCDNLGQVDLQHIVNLIVKCRSTIEQLYLNAAWYQLVSFDIITNFDAPGQILPTGVVVPKLKTLAIHYPSNDLHEEFISEQLLKLFPALKVLQLLHFQPHYLDRVIPAVEMVEKDMGRNDNPVALKERFAILREQLQIVHGEAVARMMASAQATGGHNQGTEFAIWGDQWGHEITDVTNEIEFVFQQLAALGEKREKVIVEQLLTRRGMWNTCRNLQIVSVSSGGKPDGDICAIRRNDDA